MTTKIKTSTMTTLIEDKFTSVSAEAYKATVENGGVTISLNGNRPSAGIAFSPFKDAELTLPKENLTPQIINDYLIRHHDRLAQERNHLGMWTTGEKVYLDISTVGEKSADTLEKAMVAKQLAAFDLTTFQDIPLGKMEYVRIYNEASRHPCLSAS
ncbi:MAG: hypothetical protein WC531_01090 [Candidatus Paceibacterota bacterium]|jgi:hypothetical protein